MAWLQAAAKIKEELEQMIKDKSDKFDTMFAEETEKIRLDETGWKSRCALLALPGP